MCECLRVCFSGVARICPVRGHWGPWVFVGGHQHFELIPPPPPKKKKKKKNPRLKKDPHFPAVQADKQNKKWSSLLSRLRRWGEEQPFTKAEILSNKHILKHILRIHKHDFCGGAKY